MTHNLTATNGRSGIAAPIIPHDTDRSTEHSQLTAQQLADLTDEAKQTEYRQAYQIQLHRQTCPGCGDE